MDFATIIGLILGFVAVVVGMVVKGADITALLNPAAKINYFYWYICAVCIAFPMNQLKRVPKLFKVLLVQIKRI